MIFMGHTTLNNFTVLHKLETIEKEVLNLKISILKKITTTGKKITSFKGILKGVDVTDKDITLAKKSLCSKVKI